MPVRPFDRPLPHAVTRQQRIVWVHNVDCPLTLMMVVWFSDGIVTTKRRLLALIAFQRLQLLLGISEQPRADTPRFPVHVQSVPLKSTAPVTLA